MHEIVNIQLSDLLLDSENPRLSEEYATQQETALNLARQQGDNLVRLADDIVKHGLDPTTLPIVIATGDSRKRYRVIEGNRRVLSLKALETPSLIAPAMSPGSNRRLTELSLKYQLNPVPSVQCVLFDKSDETVHWTRLRHTGQNQGVGLVDWGAVEQDRFNSRHSGGSRKPAGQVVEFVEKMGGLSVEAQTSSQKILTNVERLLGTPYAREKLGIDVVQGQVVSYFPADEVSRVLTRVIEDLRTGKVTVPDLYRVEQRQTYVDGLPRSVFPKRSKRLADPVLLEDLTSGMKKPRGAPTTKTPRTTRRNPRTTVIPRDSRVNVAPPRINSIYNELLTISAETFPNACSVLLRVFIELSVDHYIEDTKLMTDAQIRSTPLAKRLKKVAESLLAKGSITAKLKTAVEKVADGGQSVIAAGIPTFNQYIHNQYVYPRAAELYTTWDEIAPFMEKVWP